MIDPLRTGRYGVRTSGITVIGRPFPQLVDWQRPCPFGVRGWARQGRADFIVPPI
jgi:hypothetical protein